MAITLPNTKENTNAIGEYIKVANEPMYLNPDVPIEAVSELKVLAESSPRLKLVDPKTGEIYDEPSSDTAETIKVQILNTTNRKGYISPNELESAGLTNLQNLLEKNKKLGKIIAIKSNGAYKFYSQDKRDDLTPTDISSRNGIWGFGKFDKIEEDINNSAKEVGENIPVFNLQGEVIDREFIAPRTVLGAFPITKMKSGQLEIDLNDLREEDYPLALGNNRLAVTVFSQFSLYSVQDTTNTIVHSIGNVAKRKGYAENILKHYIHALSDHPHFNLSNIDLDTISSDDLFEEALPNFSLQFLEKLFIDIQQISMAGYRFGNDTEENLHPEGLKDMDTFIKVLDTENQIDSEDYQKLLEKNLRSSILNWRTFVTNFTSVLEPDMQSYILEKISLQVKDTPFEQLIAKIFVDPTKLQSRNPLDFS